ncbi:hypothetical protein Bca52824_084357 [Brassica carinata]|uniref:Pentatricopeptide repeat-containing protein n=1 Tax=Brassica carinata TaxID=52824 RepID=A0A8X7TUP6_BRACI|nr:hypothetical protein Bca52824_084357 [Brassica carinata]
MEKALEMLDVMLDSGVDPDVYTYNSLLNGLCKTSEYEDVIETYKTMVEKGCAPNLFTFNILLESLCRYRKLDEALGLLEEMERKSVNPDAVTFGTLIDGFCKTETWMEHTSYSEDGRETRSQAQRQHITSSSVLSLRS